MESTPLRRDRRRRRQSPVAAAVGVIGELLLTAGVLVLLFLGWQLWLNDLIVGNEQRNAAVEFGETLVTPDATPDAAPDVTEPPTDPGDPVSTIEPIVGTGFATLYVPRFGADYARIIGEGVDLGTVLNNRALGVGHYPQTQLPGELGNFALAAHRTTWGAPFGSIGDLQLGDRIYVQTADGWYVYVFRNLEYVLPTGVGVLEPVPQAPGVEAGDRFITLTSCNPRFSAAERIIAYGVLESWQPASAGMPAELAALQSEGA